MSKVLVRVLSGIIGAVFLIVSILLPEYVLSALVAIVCLIAYCELFKAFKMENNKLFLCLGLVASFVMNFLAYKGGFSLFSKGFPLIITAFVMILFICAIIRNKKYNVLMVINSVFCLIYSTFFILHLLFIRQMENGIALLFIPLVGAWIPDTFAYFTGMLCGKHKLIPAVSPKKTVEGSIGGVVGSMLMFVLYGFIVSSFGYKTDYAILIVLSVLCGIMSQFGDLSASLVKRHFDIKDFGNLMPGHGGIMDRFDSLIFIAPLCYYFLTFFMPIC